VRTVPWGLYTLDFDGLSTVLVSREEGNVWIPRCF